MTCLALKLGLFHLTSFRHCLACACRYEHVECAALPQCIFFLGEEGAWYAVLEAIGQRLEVQSFEDPVFNFPLLVKVRAIAQKMPQIGLWVITISAVASGIGVVCRSFVLTWSTEAADGSEPFAVFGAAFCKGSLPYIMVNFLNLRKGCSGLCCCLGSCSCRNLFDQHWEMLCRCLHDGDSDLIMNMDVQGWIDACCDKVQ